MMPWRKASHSETGGRRNDRAGFLLAEALATMAISAFLLVALSSVVSLMLRASDRTAQAAQDIEYSTRLTSALARDIEQIAPLRWAGRDAGFVFSGGPQTMTFAYQDGGSDQTRAVLLRRDGTQLVREDAVLSPMSRSVVDLAIEKRQATATGPLAIRFAYFGALPNGEESLTDTWERTDLMPVAIRVSLTDSDGAVRISTRVALHVDAERSCFLPGRTQCSLAPPEDVDGNEAAATAAPIDPDDALGWMRYIP